MAARYGGGSNVAGRGGNGQFLELGSGNFAAESGVFPGGGGGAITNRNSTSGFCSGGSGGSGKVEIIEFN